MPLWSIGRLVPNACRTVFEYVRRAVQFLEFRQQVPLARFSRTVWVPLSRSAPVRRGARGAQQRYLFLGVNAPTRDRAQAILDSVCRVACSMARSEQDDLVFGDHLSPVQPNTFPLSPEPRVWHFSRGEYEVGATQETWRIPAAPAAPQEDFGDPLAPPEADSLAPPVEPDPAVCLAGAPDLAVPGAGASGERFPRLLF